MRFFEILLLVLLALGGIKTALCIPMPHWLAIVFALALLGVSGLHLAVEGGRKN